MRSLKPVAVGLLVMAILLVLPLFAGCGSKSTSPTPTPVNHAPNQPVVQVNPGSVSVGGTATVTVSCYDQDGDALTYSYSPNGGSISGSGASVTWTAPTTAGSYSVTVTVNDGKGGTNQNSGNLTVTGGGGSGGTIHGDIRLPPGLPGDLNNARVAIYANYDDWNNDRFIRQGYVDGSGAHVTFDMTNLTPGSYYLDVWSDVNHNAAIDGGDWFGVNGTSGWPNPTFTPIMVANGQTSQASIYMIAIP